MNLCLILGAGLISGFVAVNVYCIYAYLRRRLALAPRSAINHGIVQRFANAEELEHFHRGEVDGVVANANQALAEYGRQFEAELAHLDPLRKGDYRIPRAAFGSAAEIEQLARRRVPALQA